jgi:formate dehydrogenase subunit gamma
MSLFQMVSIVGIGGALAAMPVHYLLIARKAPRPGLGMKTVRRYGLWERLVHLALALSFLVLAATGFAASIGWNGPMGGYTLMFHTTAGAVFAVSVACMLVTWAADHAFRASDGRWFRGGGLCTPVKELPAGRFTAGEKIYFWLAGPLALAALLSMLLSMIPVLATSGQALMYQVHRWSTLVLVVATIWHAYATTLAKPGTLGALVSGYVSEGWAKRFHPLWGGGAGPGQPHAD